MSPSPCRISSLILPALLAMALPASAQRGTISSDVPTVVHADGQYIIYLHGRIIEVQGRRPTHPTFGVYEYDLILEEFAARGFEVISEVRPADTEVASYSERVAGQIRTLVDEGVAPEHITVVGFSKGGLITIATSSLLRMPGVQYAILAGCFGATAGSMDYSLSGRILSIHEASDRIGRSCVPLFERSPEVTDPVERRIETGAAHGAFYTLRDAWVGPLFTWITVAKVDSEEDAGPAIENAAPVLGGGTARLRVGLALQRYTARPGGDEISTAPDLLHPEVVALMDDVGIEVGGVKGVELTPAEKGSYGVWQRMSLADGHLGRAVAPMARDGDFVLGLLGNCISSWGMLAGLQHSGSSGEPLRVGLIWIDAHGDFNTPETTLSGWLGGMPVSVAAGQSLARLRTTAGLNVPIYTQDIVQMGLRDVDPLEQILIDESHITVVSPEDMVRRTDVMRNAVERLSEQVDVIYLHVDLDILDAAAIPGSFFETRGGPTATEVAEVLRELIANPKVKALGIASFPTAEQGRQTSMRSTLTLVRAALEGLRDR